jgi:hypothetical protein
MTKLGPTLATARREVDLQREADRGRVGTTTDLDRAMVGSIRHRSTTASPETRSLRSSRSLRVPLP